MLKTVTDFSLFVSMINLKPLIVLSSDIPALSHLYLPLEEAKSGSYKSCRSPSITVQSAIQYSNVLTVSLNQLTKNVDGVSKESENDFKDKKIADRKNYVAACLFKDNKNGIYISGDETFDVLGHKAYVVKNAEFRKLKLAAKVFQHASACICRFDQWYHLIACPKWDLGPKAAHVDDRILSYQARLAENGQFCGPNPGKVPRYLSRHVLGTKLPRTRV